MRGDHGPGVCQLGGTGIATEREFVGAADLFRGVIADLGLHADGEGVSLFESETAVEKVERLNRRGALTPARGALAGVGTIESSEHRLALAADLVRVDHPAQAIAAEGLNGLEAAQSATIVEQVEPAAVHLQVQLPAHREYRVTDRLGLKTS